MKKNFLIILVFFLFGIMCSFAFAQSNNQEITSIGEVSSPGILPDSPFYFLKTWGRFIRSFFTFDILKKAELELKFANEDALAIQKLCDEGKCELAEKFSQKFQQRLQNAIQLMERAKQNGKDVEALVEKLKENYLRQQQVLSRVLEKAPEQAQEGILNAISKSSFGLENAIERIQGKQKMEQFREELNLQTQNVGEETRLKIQERLRKENPKLEESPINENQQNESEQKESNQKNVEQEQFIQETSTQEEREGETPQQQEFNQNHIQQQGPVEKGSKR